jgi:hypothetical protein
VIKMTTSEKNFEKMSKMRRVKSDDEWKSCLRRTDDYNRYIADVCKWPQIFNILHLSGTPDQSPDANFQHRNQR